jgi:hypothetical protein
MGYCVVRRYTGNPNDLPLILHTHQRRPHP